MNHIFYDLKVDSIPSHFQASPSIDELLAVGIVWGIIHLNGNNDFFCMLCSSSTRSKVAIIVKTEIIWSAMQSCHEKAASRL